MQLESSMAMAGSQGGYTRHGASATSVLCQIQVQACHWPREGTNGPGARRTAATSSRSRTYALRSIARRESQRSAWQSGAEAGHRPCLSRRCRRLHDTGPPARRAAGRAGPVAQGRWRSLGAPAGFPAGNPHLQHPASLNSRSTSNSGEITSPEVISHVCI